MEECYGGGGTPNNAAPPTIVKSSNPVSCRRNTSDVPGVSSTEKKKSSDEMEIGNNGVDPPHSSSFPSLSSVLGDATSTTSNDDDSRHRRKRNREKDGDDVTKNSKCLRSSNSVDMNSTRVASLGLVSRKRLLDRTLPRQELLVDGVSETFARATKKGRGESDSGSVGGEGEGMQDGQNGSRDRTAVGNIGGGTFNFDEDIDNHDDASSPSVRHKALSDPSCRHGSVSMDKLSRACVLPRAPACPHLSVTGSEGRRVYLRIMDVESRERCKGLSHSGLKLLTVPFAELKAGVEEEVNNNVKK